MHATLKDFRLHATVLALVAFIAGKFSYARFLPMAADLPHWATEVRFPLLLAATALAGAAWFARGERPIRSYAYWGVSLAFAAYTCAYLFLPFTLTKTADISFGLFNLLLFAGLAHPRLLEPTGQTFIAISTLLIAVSFAAMPFTESFMFASNSSTFVKILAVGIFLLLCRRGGAAHHALLALHVVALIYSIQISSIVALLVAAAAVPVLFVCRVFDARSLAVNLAVAAVAVLIGFAGNQATIEEKIAFRMKQAEVREVVKQHGNTKSQTFPGGLYETKVVRNGETQSISMPDFNKDTRVCIDDRSDRIKLYSVALLMHSQAPDRWGWGDDAFMMKLQRFGVMDEHRHPHNIFLEVLVTRGPYFLLAFLAIVYVGTIKALVAAYRAPETAPYVIGMAYILAASQWSGDYFDFRWFFMLMVPALAAGFGKTRNGDL